jgi:hypothetical protein
VSVSIRSDQVQPLLVEAPARWQAAPEGGRGNSGIFIGPGAALAPSWNPPAADPAVTGPPAPANAQVLSPALPPATGDSRDELVLRTGGEGRSDPFADEWSAGPWGEV